jgi:hypothetical protein
VLPDASSGLSELEAAPEPEAPPLEEPLQDDGGRPEIGNWRDQAGAFDDDDESADTGPSPLDRPSSSETLDVDAARQDRNVDLDRKIRSMGWSEYGQRLRRVQQQEQGGRGNGGGRDDGGREGDEDDEGA